MKAFKLDPMTLLALVVVLGVVLTMFAQSGFAQSGFAQSGFAQSGFAQSGSARTDMSQAAGYAGISAKQGGPLRDLQSPQQNNAFIRVTAGKSSQ